MNRNTQVQDLDQRDEQIERSKQAIRKTVIQYTILAVIFPSAVAACVLAMVLFPGTLPYMVFLTVVFVAAFAWSVFRLAKESTHLAQVNNTQAQEIKRQHDEIQTLADQKQRLADELRWQRDHDPLTGALTRAAGINKMQAMLVQWWNQEPELVLFMILLFLDVNTFKAINEIWGYAEGDRVLQEVVAMLRELCRKEDDEVARWGGDEFFLPCWLPDRPSAEAMAQRLRTGFKLEPLVVPPAKLQKARDEFNIVTDAQVQEGLEGKKITWEVSLSVGMVEPEGKLNPGSMGQHAYRCETAEELLTRAGMVSKDDKEGRCRDAGLSGPRRQFVAGGDGDRRRDGQLEHPARITDEATRNS